MLLVLHTIGKSLRQHLKCEKFSVKMLAKMNRKSCTSEWNSWWWSEFTYGFKKNTRSVYSLSIYPHNGVSYGTDVFNLKHLYNRTWLISRKLVSFFIIIQFSFELTSLSLIRNKLTNNDEIIWTKSIDTLTYTYAYVSCTHLPKYIQMNNGVQTARIQSKHRPNTLSDINSERSWLLDLFLRVLTVLQCAV